LQLSFGPVQNSKFNGIVDIYYSSGGTYKGYCKSGLKNGIGRFTWSTGKSYLGEYSEDEINGKGILTYPDGTIDKGLFVNSVFKAAHDFDQTFLD
jgi:hypothetical protein